MTFAPALEVDVRGWATTVDVNLRIPSDEVRDVEEANCEVEEGNTVAMPPGERTVTSNDLPESNTRMDTFEVLRLLHGHYGPDFLRVRFDSSLGD